MPKTEASRSASTCLVMLNSVMLIGVGLEVTPRRGAGFARDPVTVTGLAPIHRSAWRCSRKLTPRPREFIMNSSASATLLCVGKRE